MPIQLIPSSFSSPPRHHALDAGVEASRRIADSLVVVAGLVHVQASRLGTQPAKMDVDDVRSILNQVGGRIEAVAQLHRTLAEQEDDQIALGPYLRDICADAAAGGPNPLELRFAAAPDCRVCAERALSIGFIVHELVANAARFAHPTGVPGWVKVDCARHSDGTLAIAVSDDGVGLPEGFDPRKSRGFGLLLVWSLVDRLKASLAFDSGPLGLSVVLRVPADRRQGARQASDGRTPMA